MPFLQRAMGGVHSFLYRASDGRVGSKFRGAPVLLLTTTGHRSGKERTTPLLYARDSERIVIIASNGGRDRHPSWWTNLRRDPRARVQIGKETINVTARKAQPEEKERLWGMMTKNYPPYDDYQKKTTREIPVVVLTPETESL